MDMSIIDTSPNDTSPNNTLINNVFGGVDEDKYIDEIEYIQSNSKKYEVILNKLNPIYSKWIEANEYIKQYIRDNKFIVYGGTAIDFALRIKGDSIYPDELLPVMDLDFFSSDNIIDAYKLGDVLYDMGYIDVAVKPALHVQTMRVDLVNNTFIADISYCPKNIYDNLKYLTYDGMRILHPNLQKIDMHYSLSFPYIGPPRESIFSRWKKDLKRFDILNQHYPITWQKVDNIYIKEHIKRIVIDDKLHEKTKMYLIHGFAAYALYYTAFIDIIKGKKETTGNNKDNKDNKEDKDIIIPNIAIIEGNFSFETFDNIYTVISVDDTWPNPFISRHPYINFFPGIKHHTHKGINETIELEIFDHSRKQVAIQKIIVEKKEFIVPCIQYLLHYFLAKSQTIMDQNAAQLYMNYYLSCMQMIKRVFDVNEDAVNSIFGLSITTFGEVNQSDTYKMMINKLDHELYGIEQINKPQAYYVDRGRKNNTQPKKFDYSTEFFKEDGLIDK